MKFSNTIELFGITWIYEVNINKAGGFDDDYTAYPVGFPEFDTWAHLSEEAQDKLYNAIEQEIESDYLLSKVDGYRL